MNRATNFVLYALVGRHLGAHEFGQLSLALTLFYIFQVVAVAGLKTLIIRQVTKDRTQTGLYFISGLAIVTVSSLFSVAMTFGFVRSMHYPADTALVILLLSLGLFPYAISAVCEGIFQAWEQMRFIPCVNVPVNVAKVGAAFFLLRGRSRLYAVVLTLLSSFLVTALVEVSILFRKYSRRPPPVDFGFCLATFRSAVTFLGIDGTIAIMSSLNVLLLSKLATETDVGLYSAAMQLMVPLLLVYQSAGQSIFPLMCRKIEPGFQSLKRIAMQVIELLLILALPAVAGMFFLGDRVLGILYRNPAFLQAFPVLRIVAWTLVSQIFTSVLGQVLVASHREKITLRIVVVDTIVNLLVGWPLISMLGLRGAALALLVTRLVDCCQHYIPVSRLFSGIPLARIIWKPILAAVCMAAYLALTLKGAAILRGVSATVIYAATLTALFIWASGGLRQFREKYSLLSSE